MNKQEAIKRVEELYGYGSIAKTVTDIISQIHEPQQVVVPAFIDSFIRYAKAEGMSLFIAMDNARNKESEWIITNEDTFARAWLFGYEVEKEQLYTVEIPDPNSYCDYRYLSRNENGICLDASNNTKWKQKKRNQFTESEIKQDFEWAWDAGFAKEVENDTEV
ncbi:TPA: DUF1642 domain-containing protein [Streptococcus suis]